MDIRPETKRLLEVVSRLERANSYSAAKIAEMLGVSPSAITELKKERTNAGKKLIQKFTKVFKIDNDWLFTGEGEMFTTQAKSTIIGSGQTKMYVDDLVPTIMMLKDQYKLLQDEYRFISDELRTMKEKMLEALQKDTKKQKTPQTK